MAVTVRRDPGQRVLVMILGLSYANLLVKGWLWIFAATAIALDELWPLLEPLRALIK